MRTKGEIVNAARFGNKLQITLLTDYVDGVELLSGTQDIQINPPQKKRSLDANAYFHLLIGMIADALTVSKAYAKNTMLGKYGQRLIEESGPVTYIIKSDIDMMENETIHVKPIGYCVIDGEEYTEYAIVRGSHEYSVSEMHYLINGTESDAKDLGIDISEVKARCKAL